MGRAVALLLPCVRVQYYPHTHMISAVILRCQTKQEVSLRLASLRTHATCNMQRSKLLPELKERAERAERTALIIFHLEINNPSWTWELGSREYLSWRLIQFWTLAFFSVYFCLFLSFSVFFCLFLSFSVFFIPMAHISNFK